MGIADSGCCFAANMYADMREEARDHARVRNAYFDQVRVV